MTPDRRLNQIEPILADVVQKVDRLIDSNGQILEVAIRADNNAAQAKTNAEIAARGIAALTTEMRDGFQQVDVHFQQVDVHFQQVDARFQQVDIHFQQINARIDGLENSQAEFRQEVNQRFDQLITLIQERLK